MKKAAVILLTIVLLSVLFVSCGSTQDCPAYNGSDNTTNLYMQDQREGETA